MDNWLFQSGRAAQGRRDSRKYSQSERRLTNYMRDAGRQSAVILVNGHGQQEMEPMGLKT